MGGEGVVDATSVTFMGMVNLGREYTRATSRPVCSIAEHYQ